MSAHDGVHAAIGDAVAAHSEACSALSAGDLAAARRASATAVNGLRAALGPDDPDVANVLLTASQIERSAGDLAAARTLAGQAVAAARTWSLADDELVSLRFEAEVQLATLEQSLGDLSAAEQRLLGSLAQARTIASAQRSVLLLINALGVTYKFAGRLDDAQRCYDEVYDLLHGAQTPDPADLAGLFHNLAGLAHSRGDALSGILWAQRGIALRLSLGEQDGLDLARDHGGLGALQHLAGHHDEARDSYARAHDATVAALGPDHHEFAVILANQAALEADTGNPAAAIALYERALTLLTAALGRDHAEVQFVQHTLDLLTGNSISRLA